MVTRMRRAPERRRPALSGVALREAKVDDIEGMHVVRLAVRENRLSRPDVVTAAHYREMLDLRGKGWVVEDGGRIVAFSIADLRTRSIWALFVDPDHEGQGHGRRLLAHAVEWLFAARAPSIWLTTAPGTRAERFYLAAGWTRVGIEPTGEVRFERAIPA